MITACQLCAKITVENALREEAERIEREALNGVPDMVDDTPQDARARGYRRVSGHKIDRQEPVQGLQGKEVAVRFSDDAIANGRVAVIDATQLQPSHIQGVRNPLHFIDIGTNSGHPVGFISFRYISQLIPMHGGRSKPYLLFKRFYVISSDIHISLSPYMQLRRFFLRRN